jgi:hypothetical protein
LTADRTIVQRDTTDKMMIIRARNGAHIKDSIENAIAATGHENTKAAKSIMAAPAYDGQ